MRQIFFDQTKAVFIKIFLNSQALEREICGSNSFKKLVAVPQIEVLDQKVAKISLMPGILGYQITEQELNILISKFLQRIKLIKINQDLTIFRKLNYLKKFFKSDPKSLNRLNRIEQNLKGASLFPVHGDIQKQNIVILNGKLGLIDFEHFIFAPRELELCNSLFFNDGNCLNIEEIVSYLPRKLFSKKILKEMLVFYALKQQMLGMNKIEAENKLRSALMKAHNLKFTGKQSLKGVVEFSSFCYI